MLDTELAICCIFTWVQIKPDTKLAIYLLYIYLHLELVLQSWTMDIHEHIYPVKSGVSFNMFL